MSDKPREIRACICGHTYMVGRYPDGHCQIGSAFDRVVEERDWLRGEVDRLKPLTEGTNALAVLFKERDRYRQALERIAAYDVPDAHEMLRIAQEALEGKK